MRDITTWSSKIFPTKYFLYFISLIRIMHGSGIHAISCTPLNNFLKKKQLYHAILCM
jgi:hypothetical protein